MREKRYIQVILPLRLEWEPCYCLDADGIFVRAQKEPAVGDRIKVFFARRPYTAVVSAVDVKPGVDPSRVQALPEDFESGLPPVSPQEIEFWRFLADYYLCTVGEVYKAAYPMAKIASEQVQARVTERRKRLTEKEIDLWKTRVAKLSARLASKDAAIQGRHREEVLARLRAERAGIASELEEAQRRLARLSGEMFAGEGASAAVPAFSRDPLLAQAFASGRPVLLKSPVRYESYRNLAAETLSAGRGVLFLVPEIGLAKSLQTSLEEDFGAALMVHHSEETPVQRRRISDAVRSGGQYLLLGTRSSLFLPFSDLGLIIVDGEQSPFYKSDTAPRLNARDAAVVLAGIHRCRVLLGASSPSLESLLNARNGRYSFVDGSADGLRLHPFGEYAVVDTRAERRKNGMLGCISRKLAGECRRHERVAIIRGFEKKEEVEEQLASLFPGDGRFEVFSIPEASRRDLSEYDFAAMLSAEALFRADDFRSDERAFQFLDSLRCQCRNVLVQTADAAHQVFRLTGPEALLEERRRFGLPPYTRLVDVVLPDCSRFPDIPGKLSRRLVSRGFHATDALPRPDGRSFIRVTFRRDRSLAAHKKALSEAVQAFMTEHKLRSGAVLDADPVQALGSL